MDPTGGLSRSGRRVVLVLALCLPACSSWCSSRDDAKPAPKPAAPRVELLEPGREPRVELEVGRWTGLRYWMMVENEGSFGVQGLPPAKAPKSTVTLAFEVVRGAADPIERERDGEKLRLIEERSVLEHVTVSSSELAPEQLQVVQNAFGLLRGTTTKQLVSDSGEIVEIKTELVGGQKPTPEIQRLLDEAFDVQRRFPFRLPRRPVGVGARWRFKEPMELKGISATQIADMTLVALGERSARIGIRVRLQAGSQTIPHPLDPARTATLDGFRGDGDGELEIDRMTAVVLSSRLATTATLKLSSQDAKQQKQTATFMSANVLVMRGGTGAPPQAAPPPDAAADAQ